MKKSLLILLILALILPFGIVTAQEPPIGSSEDNACNKGGSMEGKCDTEWEWICGYYLAHWEKEGGWSSSYIMPDSCLSLLPPRPAPAQDSAAGSITGSISCSVAVTSPVRFRHLLAPSYAPGGFTLSWSTSVDPTSVVILRNGGSPKPFASPGSASVGSGTYSLMVNGVVLASTTCSGGPV